MSEEMKPCPFCGEKAELNWYGLSVELGCHTIRCRVAPRVRWYIEDSEDKREVEAEIIKLWNTRANVAEN